MGFEKTCKLDEMCGIADEKNKIENYIYYVSVSKKEHYANYNVIINDESSNDFDTKQKLIDYLYKSLKKYKIVRKLYFLNEEDTRKIADDLILDGDLIIIDEEIINFKSIRIEKSIKHIMKKHKDKVFFIVGKDDDYNELLESFFSHVDWCFKISEANNSDKLSYIRKSFKKNKIVIHENVRLEDCLCKKDFSYIKLELTQIITECKKNKISAITSDNYKSITNISDFSDFVEDNKSFKSELRLEDVIGLNEVKLKLIKIVQYLKICKKNGVKRPSIHMCFMGNPGTGKTTLARILGEMLANENVLTNKNFVEIHGRDLIGKYVGWTSEKVKKVVNSAMGGVLFIDEAYSLDSDRKSFEDEAISTLIKEMEDKREDICIIFAGYKNDMYDFIYRNSGLESRIQFYIDFPNYSKDELLKIFGLMVKKDNYRISKSANSRISEYFDENKDLKNFSNGRFVRNLFEKIKIEQANRIIRSSKNSKVINLEDVQNAINESLTIHLERKKIGF